MIKASFGDRLDAWIHRLFPFLFWRPLDPNTLTVIGTLVSVMLPYSVVFLITWTIFLLAYWGLGIPLGLQASYTYP